MSILQNTVLIVCVATASLFNLSNCEAGDIDPELQRVVGKFMTGVDKKIDKVLEEFTKHGMKWCVLENQLKNKMAEGLRFEYAIKDVLREHISRFEETRKAILSALAPNSTKEVTSKEVDELAMKIAVNEVSLTKIKEEVIPALLNQNKRLLGELKSLDLKVLSLSDRFDSRLESLCDRVAKLEQERAAQSPNLPNKVYEQRSVLRPIYRVKPEMAMHPPSAYFSTAELCPSARLVQQNCIYNANVVTSRGTFVDQMFGDLYWDCTNQFVMVLRDKR